MDKLFQAILEAADSASPPLLLLAAFASGLIETVFPPFPSEGVLIAVAFAAARNGSSPIPVALAAALGSFTSLYGLYLLGRSHLQADIRKWLTRLHSDADVWTRNYYQRWGYLTVLISRFLPGIRGPITLLAGIYGLKRWPMAMVLLTGCLVWNAIIVTIGAEAGRRWDGSSGGLVWIGVGVAGCLLGLWLVGVVLTRRVRRG